MNYFDISVPVSEDLPFYSGDPPTRVQLWEEMAKGALADVRSINMGTHTGTHVDAPAHFLPGARTVDELDLSACMGPARVLDLTGVGYAPITRTDLEAVLPPTIERVILKTRNSELWARRAYEPSFAALALDSAELLLERGVRLIGIDYLSIARSDDPAPVHRLLLEAEVVILEGLNLTDVPEGQYTLVCMPLRLRGAEGAPSRAILIP